MNLFLSSGFKSTLFKNNKSLFNNSLTSFPSSFDTIELRSIAVDNRVTYLNKFADPIFIFTSNERLFIASDDTILKQTEKSRIRFDTNISILATCESKSGFDNFHIKTDQSEFSNLIELVHVLNEHCQKVKCGFNLGIITDREKNEKIFFKRNGSPSKIRIRVTLPRAVAYALGFTLEYREISFFLPSKIKKKGKYSVKKEFSYSTLLWIRQFDAENSKDLINILDHILVKTANICTASNRSTNDYYRANILSSKVKKVKILKDFIDCISLDNAQYNSPVTSNSFQSNIEYYDFPSAMEINIKTVPKPKLIKIFCEQISHNTALSSSSLNLLALLPYSDTVNYSFVSENPIKSLLYTSKLNQLTFKLTDENGSQLKLATGTPTFIECKLSKTLNKMIKVCHFNSNAKENLRFFTTNTQSRFTQILTQPIDARNETCYANLQSIYIPPALHNIDSELTTFSIFLENENRDVFKMSLENGFYTPESFLQSLNEKIIESGVCAKLLYEKIIFENQNEFDVKLIFNPQLAYLLGYTTEVDRDEAQLELGRKGNHHFLYSFKFLSLVPRFLKIKANMLTNSLIGNNLQPIFRIINLDLNKTLDSKRGQFIEFPSEHWVAMYPQLYNRIDISLHDEYNREVKFDSGESVEGVFVVKEYANL